MSLIVGVDEAGRGPWAGPVVAAAVLIKDDAAAAPPPHPLRDSKKCTAHERAALYRWIIHHFAHSYAIRAASARHIDRRNIRQATLDAMTNAVAALSLHGAQIHVLIDGKDTLPLPHHQRAIIKGDDSVPVIAAAAILAKVTRDAIMTRLAVRYPHYHWQRNKGYGTAQHKDALHHYGVTPHHRMTFQPIRAFITP